MSLALIGGAYGVSQKIFAGINSGACGKKCRGFGKALKNCRRQRTANCNKQKEAKRAQEVQTMLANQAAQMVAQSNQPTPAAIPAKISAGMPAGISVAGTQLGVGAIIGIVGIVISLLLFFLRK